MSLKTIRSVIIFCAFFILAGGIGFRLGERQSTVNTSYFPRVEISHKESPFPDIDFNQFWEVWNKVSYRYLEKKAIDPQKMIYGAISGMVSSLGDPYTVFLTPEQNKGTKEELEGSFEGIGAQLGFKDHQLVVVAPLKGTPAEKAGVRAGDAILRIEDKDTVGITLPEAVSKIRGPKGTKVKLTVLHEKEEKSAELVISRETIIVKSVEWEKKLVDGKTIAYLKLLRFGDNTSSEWDRAVSEIEAQNISRIILDVRNNPGGYLTGAIYIASEFLSDGAIVIQESSSSEKTIHSVSRRGSFLSEKLVVLVNKGSASASEIVAGAIQDRKRAILIGEGTFGKGTVQEALDLERGAGLHITTARWLLPSGKSIDKAGLSPDYTVKMDEKDLTLDPQLEKALTEVVK